MTLRYIKAINIYEHRKYENVNLFEEEAYSTNILVYFINSTLEYLFQNKWLDTYTRAIFAEFTVYNANVNLFCIVTFLMETTAVGKVGCFI